MPIGTNGKPIIARCPECGEPVNEWEEVEAEDGKNPDEYTTNNGEFYAEG